MTEAETETETAETNPLVESGEAEDIVAAAAAADADADADAASQNEADGETISEAQEITENSKSPSANEDESKEDDAAAVTTEETTRKTTKTTTKTTVPEPIEGRPPKRARTAYFIFADVMRPRVQQEHPGEGVATQAKAIGALWKSIEENERDKYKAMATKEKEAFATAMTAYQAKFGSELESNNNANQTSEDDLVFPVARIRKIAKLDPEVKTLSKEALQLVVKSAELALAKLGQESVKVARLQNRRTLLADDIAHVCSHREAFRFLKEDIADLTKALLEAKENNNNNNNGGAGAATSGGGKKDDSKMAAAASGTKPLTSYFGVNKK